MKRIGATVTIGVLIAVLSGPGALRAQPKDRPDRVTLSALAAQVAALQTTVSSLQAQLSAESPINALAANFLNFDGTEVFTHNPPLPGAQGGTPIYDNFVTVPPGTNTLYVTIGATADLDHVDNALFIACRVDGVPCTSGPTAENGSPSGWIMMEDLSATAQPDLSSQFPFADNNFSYTWCTHIGAGNSHTVQLRLASAISTNVFVEQYHVFVNGATIQDPTQACTPGTL